MSWTSGIETLYPGYFAVVMATGIVSITAHLHGLESIAKGLLWLNVSVYLLLWGLTLIRSIRFRAQFIGDLTRHSLAASFLTKAAGTCVLGCQFALLTTWIGVAEALWFLGIGLWGMLNHLFFTVIIVREPKPSLEAGINGAWLLVIVATEAISVLGSLVAPSMAPTEVVLFICLAAYFAGAMLYVFLAPLILYRLMFFGLKPENLTPDYWIDMGALAITTLAGTLLLQAASQWHLLETLASFLTGCSLFFWAASTWWIPLLTIVELWQHLFGRVPLRYSPDYCSLVFPLGMYAVATGMLVKVARLAFLNAIAEAFAYIALIAWAVTFAAMIHSLARAVLNTGERSAETAETCAASEKESGANNSGSPNGLRGCI